MDRLLLYGYLEEIHVLNGHGLASVANDIIEEQGGPADSARMDLPPLETPPPVESPEPADTLSASTTPPSSEPSGDSDNRLAAVEQSMADLTGAVREELTLLRKALLNQRDPDDDEI